jgi:hypothetical protein
MRTRIAFAAALLISAAAVANAAKLEETFDKTYDVQPGARLALDNTNGHVTVHGSNDARVHIHAVKTVESIRSTAATDAMRELRIDVKPAAGGLNVTTHYPKSAEGGFFDWLAGSNVNVSVTYDISIPRAMNLDIGTVNGRIEIADVSGSLKLETTNGRIEVAKCRGSIDAETTNGGIKAELLQVTGNHTMFLGTTNGHITLSVPHSLAATINAETTNGSINTELPVTTTSKAHRSSLRGTVNGGGPELKLRTTNGGIDILAMK